MFCVKYYDEAPTAPVPTQTFASLREARKAVREHVDGRRVTTLAGERYEDGSTHVEAYYDSEHESSGWWILRLAD